MKTLGLCILVATCLAPISRSQEPAKPTKDNPAALQNFSADVRSAESTQLSRYSDLSPDGESYCAFMRTYRVRREHRGSDVVRSAGYTTCVPSRRFELKSAVEVQPEQPPQ